jgi:lipoprotein-releasing system ATP-binding protein
MLQVRGVSKTYRDGDRILEVLRGVDLTVHRGEAVAIIGSSGAGKSTLLHILGALDRPSQGEITLDGQMYSRLGDKQLAALRARHVGFIYQFHHLLPEFSALENVLVPGLILEMRYSEMIERASQLLRAVGLGERLDHRPARLSGGEQQRVALARALMNNPDLVLADEPTGDLDQETGQAVIDLIWKETIGSGRSFIIVTHDPLIAGRANRIYSLEHGQLRLDRAH